MHRHWFKYQLIIQYIPRDIIFRVQSQQYSGKRDIIFCPYWPVFHICNIVQDINFCFNLFCNLETGLWLVSYQKSLLHTWKSPNSITLDLQATNIYTSDFLQLLCVLFESSKTFLLMFFFFSCFFLLFSMLLALLLLPAYYCHCYYYSFCCYNWYYHRHCLLISTVSIP